jgi:bifunctional DNA-binding transcriptional regulator/antitoxin component of YhaV-PrlF toxin-antitoxin module
MAKATIQVNDPKFRIVIPQDIRNLEDISIGDFVEIDIRKIEKPKAAI